MTYAHPAERAVLITRLCAGHYIATRSFGPIEYRAVAIPRGSEQSG